jgi:TonB-dependent starch-binding outer membrane protein SusC
LNQGYMPFTYNAVDELYNNGTVGKDNIFRLTGAISGKIYKGIKADISFMSQRQFGSSNTINGLDSYATRIRVNTGTTVANGRLPF